MEVRSKRYVHSYSADRRECTLNRRREQRFLSHGRLSPVDREAGRLNRALAKLYSSLCLATAVDKENSSVLIIPGMQKENEATIVKFTY